MKIQIVKEKKGYFGKVIGEEGAYAVGESIEETLDNLMDVYYKVIEIKKNILKKEFSSSNKSNISLNNIKFSI